MKVSRLFIVGASLTAALLLSQLPGCSGSSSSTSSTSSTAGTGTLKVGLTDKQSAEFQSVFIAIREIRLVPAGMEGAEDNDPRLPRLIPNTAPFSVDILTLRFQQELLGAVVIPAGIYNQVRLILAPAPANYLTLKSNPNKPIPFKTPSGQTSGLKVLGRFEVKEGVINAILLDFDPNTAIVVRGNGDYNLKPTGIRIVQTADYIDTFGSLTGTVVATFKDWSGATLRIVPAGSSGAIATGRLFSSYSSGRWEAPFSAFVPGGNDPDYPDYRVHISDAKGFDNYSSPPMPVRSGVETNLGEIMLVPNTP